MNIIIINKLDIFSRLCLYEDKMCSRRDHELFYVFLFCLHLPLLQAILLCSKLPFLSSNLLKTMWWNMYGYCDTWWYDYDNLLCLCNLLIFFVPHDSVRSRIVERILTPSFTYLTMSIYYRHIFSLPFRTKKKRNGRTKDFFSIKNIKHLALRPCFYSSIMLARIINISLAAPRQATNHRLGLLIFLTASQTISFTFLCVAPKYMYIFLLKRQSIMKQKQVISSLFFLHLPGGMTHVACYIIFQLWCVPILCPQEERKKTKEKLDESYIENAQFPLFFSCRGSSHTYIVTTWQGKYPGWKPSQCEGTHYSA